MHARALNHSRNLLISPVNSRFAEPQGIAGTHQATQRIKMPLHFPMRRSRKPAKKNGVTTRVPRRSISGPHKNHGYRVSRLKSNTRCPLPNIIPAKLVLKRTFQHAEPCRAM